MRETTFGLVHKSEIVLMNDFDNKKYSVKHYFFDNKSTF
jgi:hypothetical protein